jgi:catechol 2,3-dioxygenase-like lactoylglutathione lyase family enzyme
MERAKLIGIAPQLVVNDVVKTAEYYQEILGFHLINYALDPPVYAMVQRDGFQVHFAKADSNTLNITTQARKIGHDFIIWVPEIDAFFEELKAKGANIIEGIVKRSYGSREFVIEDCDGHTILVGD